MIVWPYVSYHDLIQKTSTLTSTHFPILVQKAVAFWQFLKQLSELYILTYILISSLCFACLRLSKPS